MDNKELDLLIEKYENKIAALHSDLLYMSLDESTVAQERLHTLEDVLRELRNLRAVE
jgi:hypothetical protein